MQERVIRSAISEGSLTAEELDVLLNRPQREFELQIATSAHAYPQDFLFIAIHGKIETQEAMATNPAIPDEVVRQLLKAPSEHCALGTARRRSTCVRSGYVAIDLPAEIRSIGSQQSPQFPRFRSRTSPAPG